METGETQGTVSKRKKKRKAKTLPAGSTNIGPSPGLGQANLGSIDPNPEGIWTLRSPNRIDLPHTASIRPSVRVIELLVENYLTAEHDLATAVDAVGAIASEPT